MGNLRVAYILLRFPFLTETFVADEITEMKRQRTHVQVCSLLQPREHGASPHAEQLARQTTYAPDWYSWRLWWAQLFFLLRSTRLYLGAWKDMLGQQQRPFHVRTVLQRAIILLKAVALAHELRRADIQLLHAHFAWLSGAAALIVSRLLRIPFTVTVHAYDLYVSNDLLDWVVRSADRVIAISEYNKEQILHACPEMGPNSIVVVHCGIAVDLFSPCQHSSEPHGTLRMLSIGSLIEKKGHAALIRACQLLKEQGLDFHCTIIGRGPQRVVLEGLVRQYGLQDRVILAGARQQAEVLQAYQESDVFVLACQVARDGDRDGIPVVLMEAMAMQVPVISTHVSGIPELVVHGRTGWLVPEHNPEALAAAVLALHQHGNQGRECAHNGRALVEQEFNIQRNVSKLQAIFHNVTHCEIENSSYDPLYTLDHSVQGR